MEIQTVQTQGDGYLLNGTMSVPNSPDNRHYRMIQEWIAEGNTPDPDPSQSLENQKIKKLANVDTKKKQLLNAGFDVNGTLFDSDINAEIRYTQLVTEFSENPSYSTPWKAANNVWVTMDSALFGAVREGLKTHIAGVYTWLAAKQMEINNAETIEALDAITI